MNTATAADAYQKAKKKLFYFGLALDIAALIVLAVWGSVPFKATAAGLSLNIWVVNGIYILLFFLMMSVLHFPLKLSSGFFLEHRYQLSTQSWGSWLKDDLKKTALSFLMVMVFVQGIYALLRYFERDWWLGAGALWVVLSLFLARILPEVIIPLFYKYSQIEDGDLRRRVVVLFEKCGVALQDVFAINMSAKTKKANAFVCGLGKKRRVVLGDTLLENFSADEIEAVVAHELGHYKNRDIIKQLVVNAAVILVSFFIVDKVLSFVLASMGGYPLSDIASLPIFVLCLTVLGLGTVPLTNAFSRFLERRADAFCLDRTGNKDAFIRMMEKLGTLNLAERNPSRLDEIMFHDHPPLEKRICFAREYILPEGRA